MIPNKKSSKIIEGTRLAYDAKRQMLYRKKLRSLTDRMTKEVNKKVLSLFRSNAAEEFKEEQEILSAMDESISSMSRILMNKLTNKWQQIFASHSKDYAEQMVKGELVASNKSLTRSLKSMSVDVTLTSSFIPKNIKEIAKAAIAENIGLIKSIPDEYMQKITGTVMRAITSGGNIQLLQKTLSKYEGITERRVKNIADDQTRKAYNSINAQRMMDVGVKKFMWIHSGGGQKPRQEHIELNGKIFSFDDPPIIDSKTGERGLPSVLVNCACTLKPIFEFELEPGGQYAA